MSCFADRVRCVQASGGMHRLVARTTELTDNAKSNNNNNNSSSSSSNDNNGSVLSTDWSMARVLVVGAGGIGCEVLHLLALSGFVDITVVDMDTIELTNLNRQFLFRHGDVGQAKSTVAAAYVMTRCPGVHVHGVVGRVEEQSDVFYAQFDVIVMALDSVEARRFVNRKVAQLAVWEVAAVAEEEDNNTKKDKNNNNTNNKASGGDDDGRHGRTPLRYCYRIKHAIPLIDTATGGLQGQCRVLQLAHNATACVECSMHVYETRTTQVPLCTLENIPRTAQHCVLYAQLKLWPDYQQQLCRQGVQATPQPLDADKIEHLSWIAQRARERQSQFGIAGPAVDEAFALGVVKNVVPAVGFTNALVAAQAVGEVLKLMTATAPCLRNYALFDGATTRGTRHRRETLRPPHSDGGGEARCCVCGPLPVVVMKPTSTPMQLLRALLQRVSSSLHHDVAQGNSDSSSDDVVAKLTLRFTLAGGVVRDVSLPLPATAAKKETTTTTTGKMSILVATRRACSPPPVTVADYVRRACGLDEVLQQWCSGSVQPPPVLLEYTLRGGDNNGSGSSSSTDAVTRHTAVVIVAPVPGAKVAAVAASNDDNKMHTR